jgi:hypothetical protein
VDGNLIARLSQEPYETWWQLSIGEHHIWAEAVNANGEQIKSDAITVNVLSE